MIDNTNIAVCDLPRGLQELAEVIGLSNAITLSMSYGGTNLQIPTRFRSATHPITNLLGDEAAKQLIHHYKREIIYIPKASSALRSARNRQICKECDAGGQTVVSLARKHCLSERQVQTILKNTII
ncbi:MAG: transcriptional regulator [Magnetococcales bacterium]|nr:transcriptional regulator [Magnetococcales bacterium]